jgi:hypothetical protein
MVEPRRKKSRLSIATRRCDRQQEVPPAQHDNGEEETSDDSTSSSSSHETRKQQLMKEAVKTLLKRKRIRPFGTEKHQPLWERMDSCGDELF